MIFFYINHEKSILKFKLTTYFSFFFFSNGSINTDFFVPKSFFKGFPSSISLRAPDKRG